MISVFLKSIFLPSPSSSVPLSNTWKKSSITSGWAFSTSSKSTTEYGLFRTASVRTPPSPQPTYPGGDPLSSETLCASWYSDMLMVMTLSSPP
jgi:hypothetical protein